MCAITDDMTDEELDGIFDAELATIPTVKFDDIFQDVEYDWERLTKQRGNHANVAQTSQREDARPVL